MHSDKCPIPLLINALVLKREKNSDRSDFYTKWGKQKNYRLRKCHGCNFEIESQEETGSMGISEVKCHNEGTVLRYECHKDRIVLTVLTVLTGKLFTAHFAPVGLNSEGA